jgi:hypothetical protein
MLRCERISVERDGSARRAEYPLSLVEQFIDLYSLKPQVGELFDPRIGNQETHTPWWNGLQGNLTMEFERRFASHGADRTSAECQTRAQGAADSGCAPESRHAESVEGGTKGDADGTG